MATLSMIARFGAANVANDHRFRTCFNQRAERDDEDEETGSARGSGHFTPDIEHSILAPYNYNFN